MAKKKNEADMRQEDVWKEHVDEVNVAAHWAYMFGVLIGGFVLMVALIAVISGGG